MTARKKEIDVGKTIEIRKSYNSIRTKFYVDIAYKDKTNSIYLILIYDLNNKLMKIYIRKFGNLGWE